MNKSTMKEQKETLFPGGEFDSFLFFNFFSFYFTFGLLLYHSLNFLFYGERNYLFVFTFKIILFTIQLCQMCFSDNI